MFLFTLMRGSLIAISSNSWLGSWIGLEINLLSFIPLIINTNNLMSTEASLKYFLTQALASSMLLFSIIMYILITNITIQINLRLDYCNLIINSTLILKIGAAPFHFWFPGVIEGLTWINNLILITWQKIAPLILISYCIYTNFFVIIIILSVLIGSLGGLNQTSLRKIIAFSSINHLGWMLAAILVSENLWRFYFCIYSFLSFTIVYLFNTFKLFHINQAFSIFSNYPIIKFCMFISLLSLGGLPPFLGFMPKWIVIQSLTINNFLFLIIIIVCLTLITLYFYIRICYSAFILNYWETSWNYYFSYNNVNINTSLILSFISITGLILISLIYWIF